MSKKGNILERIILYPNENELNSELFVMIEKLQEEIKKFKLAKEKDFEKYRNTDEEETEDWDSLWDTFDKMKNDIQFCSIEKKRILILSFLSSNDRLKEDVLNECNGQRNIFDKSNFFQQLNDICLEYIQNCIDEKELIQKVCSLYKSIVFGPKEKK